MIIRSVEDNLFHTDRRTDMTNLIVTFRNFANAPKNIYHFTSTEEKAPHNRGVHRSVQNNELSTSSFLNTTVWRLEF